jgi:eukaryotic-like serine/threonine-protein kinase
VALGPGTRLGPYDVAALIGAGGMGEVYRARDRKLNRDVALKILPEAFAGDPERLARFKREAQVLAALNHPNIAHIYGFEDSGSTHALVLELVEGPTLADRMAKGPIPLDEALPIATQIAEALEAAHDQGIVHRDLKPANITVRNDGTVKVLDFGLAKAFDSPPYARDLSQSPTMHNPSPTIAGVILGTAAYMSPEQARGRAVDKRTDVWAFGCVLFEMLTGKNPFGGETLTDTLAAIVKNEPDWTQLPAGTPRSIRTLVARCLRKDPADRLHDIADVRIEIVDAASGSGLAPAGSSSGRSRSRERWMWASLATVLFVAAGINVPKWLTAPRPALETRLEITTPPTSDPASIAISPDGRMIVFVSTSESVSTLWIRGLDSESSRPLAGTEGATYPFWSPDGRSLGFFADDKLKRIDIRGGPAQVVSDAVSPRGGTWGPDDMILFADSAAGPIIRVRSSGGERTAVTRFKSGEGGGHRFPQLLPDGHHFLFYWFGGAHSRGVYVGDTKSVDTQRLLEADSSASYSNGRLFFVRQGTILAQDFDADRLTLKGNPSIVGEGIVVDGVSLTLPALSMAADGTIAYRKGVGRGRQLVWFDRSGRVLERVGDQQDDLNLSLSPDGRRVATQRMVNGNTDIWILELERQSHVRFTSAETLDNFPVWSPDGRYLAFGSNTNGSIDLYRKLANGVGANELLVASWTGSPVNALDWSADGRYLLFRLASPRTGYDLWVLPLDTKKPVAVVQTEFADREGQFSPDGKWIAYQSNESGRFEIYAQPFPGPGARIPISTGGGAQVRWRRDGKELFFISFDGRLMSVPVAQGPNGTLDTRPATPLFAANIGGAVQNTAGHQYVVSADGQRFLMNTLTQEAASPLTIVLNWSPKS